MPASGLQFLQFCSIFWVTLSQPIVPTYWGTYNCAAIPEFTLLDKNPASGVKYNTEYGLYDLDPSVADIIIVGLYFADSADSWANAKRQDDLGKELIQEGYSVKNVALNYYAPLSCVLDGECVNFWWNSPSFFPSYDNCMGYIAGCEPADYRLIESNWQGNLASTTSIPIFQDTSLGWIWDEFGGLQGDVYIYSTDGKLSAYLCNIENDGAVCTTPLVGGGLMNATSYATAKNASIAAAKSDNTRCPDTASSEDDYYYYGDDKPQVYYVDDYYYYNSFGETDDASFGQSISVARRHTAHKIVHKIPTYAYAALVAVMASFATCIVLYCRWKRARSRNMLNGGIVRFTQLPTEDDDAVFENTAVSQEDANPFRHDSSSRIDRYGSL